MGRVCPALQHRRFFRGTVITLRAAKRRKGAEEPGAKQEGQQRRSSSASFFGVLFATRDFLQGLFMTSSNRTNRSFLKNRVPIDGLFACRDGFNKASYIHVFYKASGDHQRSRLRLKSSSVQDGRRVDRIWGLSNHPRCSNQ